MPGGPLDDQDSADVQREAVVEMANLTNGMTGDIFDRAQGSSRLLGLSRPHSTAIWRVRAASAVAGLALAALTIASPLVLALTVGRGVGVVTISLAAAVLAAGVIFVSSYVAERREIARRVAREEG